jgi:hypothetical protein
MTEILMRANCKLILWTICRRSKETPFLNCISYLFQTVLNYLFVCYQFIYMLNFTRSFFFEGEGPRRVQIAALNGGLTYYTEDLRRKGNYKQAL